jgi:hypothetical protein
MGKSLTLPILGVLALAGAGLGFHLGNASISEIDPAYFSSPPTRFHADLSPNQSRSSAGYVWKEEPMLALGSGCAGCGDYPEEYRPVHDPAVDGFNTGSAAREAPVELAVYEEQPRLETAARDAALQRVERYSRYAVTADEQPAYASADEADIPPTQGEEEPAED